MKVNSCNFEKKSPILLKKKSQIKVNSCNFEKKSYK